MAFSLNADNGIPNTANCLILCSMYFKLKILYYIQSLAGIGTQRLPIGSETNIIIEL